MLGSLFFKVVRVIDHGLEYQKKGSKYHFIRTGKEILGINVFFITLMIIFLFRCIEL